jgi:hypothetical protein
MAENPAFQPVFERLKTILRQYEPHFQVKNDTGAEYYLEGPFWEKYKQNIFFGSTVIKKNYVSYYLMPVYVFPELLDGISPELKKRMQGKSCFNFKQVDEPLFGELEALTRRGFERY